MHSVNEEQLRNNLARNIRYLRLSKTPRMSQVTLAKKLGVSQKSIARYETARNLPPAHILLAMANYFNFSPEELLSEKLPDKKGMKTNE